jgi:predicted PurR-regulated permease PerM
VATNADLEQRASGASTHVARPDPPTTVSLAPRTVLLFVGVALGSLLLLAAVYAARTVLVQLVVAIVLAMAAEPLVQALQRRGLRRGTAVGASFTLVAVALIVFAYLALSPLVHETRQLVNDAPSLLEDLTHGRGHLGFLEERFHAVERVQAAVDSGGLTATAGPALDVLDSTVRAGGALLFVLFLTLFVQLGGRSWYEALLELLPERGRARARRTGSGIAAAVGGYVSGNLLISVIAGTVTALVLTATSVPFPLALGLLVAVFDLVPLVGATIGTVIVGGVALATNGVATAAIVVVAMILYQQLENNVLQQLVYHRTVKLSPLAIAVSVAIGAELGGVVGALLGIPLAGSLKVICAELVAWRRGLDPTEVLGNSAAARSSR